MTYSDLKLNLSGNGPALIAYYVPDRENTPWVRIGTVWNHGTVLSLSLDLVPTTALPIMLRAPVRALEDFNGG